MASPSEIETGGLKLRHLKEIEDLVRETFSLWDEKRQGFSWRNYYWNHTSRVRALCLEIGRREGADLEKLAYAATLHDITKRYDGRILTDENGRRITEIKKDDYVLRIEEYNGERKINFESPEGKLVIEEKEGNRNEKIYGSEKIIQEFEQAKLILTEEINK